MATLALLVAAPAPALAQGCTDPVGDLGQVTFNATHDVFQGCTVRGWWAFHQAWDIVPDAFGFIDQADVPLSTIITSNSVTITGIDAPTPVSVSGDGSPVIRINGGSWALSGTIENNQTLEVRLTSSASNATAHTATVDVGGLTDDWVVTTDAVSAPTGCPNIGDTCSDGSVFAGLSPDGGVPMYTTPADAPSLISWNNGSSVPSPTGMEVCYTTGQSSCRTGKANTAFLVAVMGYSEPYEAAVYCDGLTAYGHSDWYLPALVEMDVLYDNRAAIGGFNTSGPYPAGWYWSSSEGDWDYGWGARVLRFDNAGSSPSIPQTDELNVRCVRK